MSRRCERLYGLAFGKGIYENLAEAYLFLMRHDEDMLHEHGIFVDQVTGHRWMIKMLLVLAAVFRRRKRAVNSSWRLDETYIKVSGQWNCLCRAVDIFGDTVDFLLTAKRDLTAARRFLERGSTRTMSQRR